MYKILLAALISAWAFSSQASVESMQIQLKQKYPKLNIGNIQKTEMQGLYSATLDNQIIYIGENAEHILIGSMIRLKDQHNLTKDLVVKNKSIDWKSLPLQDAIKTVKGNGKRQIAIFSDPNCPYCKQLDICRAPARKSARSIEKCHDLYLYLSYSQSIGTAFQTSMVRSKPCLCME